jgi:C1A family cysteine protease
MKMRRLLLILCVIVLSVGSAYANTEVLPRIENQGNANTCVAYAVANAIEYQMRLHDVDTPENGFSKKWLYNKSVEYDIKEYGWSEGGTYLRTALNIAYNHGLVPKDDERKVSVDSIASDYKIATFGAISMGNETEVIVADIKSVLDNGGVVIIASKTTRDWLDGDITSIEGDKYTKLDHATFLIGYDDTTRQFVGVNSWGKNYGDNGKFKISYDCFVFPYVKEVMFFKVNEPVIVDDVYANAM